jgi:prepilin-type N-terminal cleavage/methylation domain-containing protein
VNRRSARQHGVTLVEMVLVVAVLAVAAALAIPKADVVGPAAVNVAAVQVANALRFARREAIRTGAYHVVKLDTAAQTLRVYRLTTSGVVAEDSARPVVHPVDMRTYNLAFSNDPASGATIASAVFKYQSGLTATYATFGPDGAPADIRGTWFLKLFVIDPLQQDGVVTLRRGSAVRTVTVAAATGRVTS